MMNKSLRLPGRRSRNIMSGTSRSGGMLILVLVIMAVGLILITSALSITLASRDRFYEDAQSSQARLTVTSAAKTVVDAILVTQEFRDELVEDWADAGETLWIRSGSGYAFNAGLGSGNTVAPGIGANTSGASGYTKATFGRVSDYITIDFETGISTTATGTTEKLTVYLEEIPPVVQPDGFGQMFKLGGDGSTNTIDNAFIGQTTGYTADQVKSNYVVLSGDMNVGTGIIGITSDVVYTDLVKSGAGNAYNGNIIFWGDEAGIYTNLAGNGVRTNQHILFLGKTPGVASVFRDASGNPGTLTSSPQGGIIGTKGQYYVNTTMLKNAWGQYIGPGDPFYIDGNVVFNDSTNNYDGNFDKVYKINASANVWYTTNSGRITYNNTTDVAAGQVQYNASSIGDVVIDYTTDLQKIANIERELPTTSEAKALAQYSSVSDITAYATKITNLTTNAPAYTGPSYYIDASTANNLTADLIFDLTNNDITLYIINSSSARKFYVGPESSSTGSIQFINGQQHWGKIVLLENGYMVVGKNNYSTYKGIITVAHSGPRTKAIVGAKPCLYIIGFGNNTVEAQHLSIVDAYIGLYGNGGKFWANNGPFIYGRIESELFESNNSFFYLDYCPGPNDPAGGEDPPPLVTKYRIASYVYS